MTKTFLLVKPTDFAASATLSGPAVIVCVQGVACNRVQPEALGVECAELNRKIQTTLSVKKKGFHQFVSLIRDDLFAWYDDLPIVADEYEKAQKFRELLNSNESKPLISGSQKKASIIYKLMKAKQSIMSS